MYGTGVLVVSSRRIVFLSKASGQGYTNILLLTLIPVMMIIGSIAFAISVKLPAAFSYFIIILVSMIAGGIACQAANIFNSSNSNSKTLFEMDNSEIASAEINSELMQTTLSIQQKCGNQIKFTSGYALRKVANCLLENK